MQRFLVGITVFCLVVAPPIARGADTAVCPPAEGVALQVLGSGGPIADDGRASSSYVVWVDGSSRVLIDAGSGSFLRFGEVGATFAALDFVGLSHFHTDHSADFPALLKTGYFSPRTRALTVAGPSGNRRFPGLIGYLSAMLAEPDGAYAYLGGYLTGSGGLAKLAQVEVSRSRETPVVVYENRQRDLLVEALPVSHGVVPALAFKVSAGSAAVVFASDQNGENRQLAQLAEGASVFVVHMPIPENANAGVKTLHAAPSRLAEIAASAKPDVLLVSHFMQRSLRDPQQGIDVIKAQYSGNVVAAEDKACLILAND